MGEDRRKQNKRSVKLKVFVIIVCVLAAFTLVGVIYVNDYYHGDETVPEALQGDSLVSVDQTVRGRVVFLPEDTLEYVIEGGNHAQFGSYGSQKGDGMPAISAEEQREAAVRQITGAMGVRTELGTF